MLKRIFGEISAEIKGLLSESFFKKLEKDDKVSYHFMRDAMTEKNSKRIVALTPFLSLLSLILLVYKLLCGNESALFEAAVIGYIGIALSSLIFMFLENRELSSRKCDEKKLDVLNKAFWIITVILSAPLIFADCFNDTISLKFFAFAVLIVAVPLLHVKESLALCGFEFVCTFAAAVMNNFRPTAILVYLFFTIAGVLISAITSESFAKEYSSERLSDINREREKQINECDASTGTLNMKTFAVRVREFFYGQSDFISAIVIDIDDMCGYNIEKGYDEGSAAIFRISGSVRIITKTSDGVMARCDGDSFIIAFEDMSEYDAVALAEQIRDSVETLEIPHNDGMLTVSVGVARMERRGGTASKLIVEAEKALQVSKKRGGNCVGYAGRCFKK